MVNGFYFFDWADALTEGEKTEIVEFMVSGGKHRLQQDRKRVNMQKMSEFLMRNPDLAQYFIG